MAKRSTETPSADTVASKRVSLSASGSANAPFVYFDSIEGFGTYNGIAHVTLTATRFYATEDGKMTGDRVVTANLRMNIPAMFALKTSLEKIEGMLSRPNGAPVN